MHKSLYRKYRPSTFKDVAGQLPITTTLFNQVESKRMGHAYLFIGPRGTGKTSCAKIFAKAVNCMGNSGQQLPCNNCAACREINQESSMDYVELDAASNNGVDDIRSICESCVFTPAKLKYRIYIIDEVHMLSIGAFNALLKTLEEPPAHVIFILATTEAHKIPATILSRCQKFEFKKIAVSDIVCYLENICKQEDVEYDIKALRAIAGVCDGAMRDALTILDKCITSGKKITLEFVEEIAMISSKKDIIKLLCYFMQKDFDNSITLLEKILKNSKEPRRVTDELVNVVRDLILIKGIKGYKDFFNVTEEEYDEVKFISDKCSYELLNYIMEILLDARSNMQKRNNPKVEIEIATVKLCNPSLEDNRSSLLFRLNMIENKLNQFVCGRDPIEGHLTSAKPSSKKDENYSEDLGKEKENMRKPQLENANVRSEMLKIINENIPIENTDSLEEVTLLNSDNPLVENKDNIKNLPSSGQNRTQVAKDNLDPLKSASSNSTTEISVDLEKIPLAPSTILKRLEQWPEILAELKKTSVTLFLAFSGSSAYLKEDIVLIDSKNDLAYELLKSRSHREKLRQAIKQLTGRIYKLGPLKAFETENQFQKFIQKAKDCNIEVIIT